MKNGVRREGVQVEERKLAKKSDMEVHGARIVKLIAQSGQDHRRDSAAPCACSSFPQGCQAVGVSSELHDPSLGPKPFPREVDQ